MSATHSGAETFTRALLVEDEPKLGEALQIALRKLGIPSVRATTLALARRNLATASDFDLILLDRRLPDGEGLTLCEELRRKGYTGAILVLTASGDTDSRVQGLDAGADDYLPKPFSWNELSARIRALSRRRNGFTPPPPTPALGPALWACDESRLSILGPKGWVVLTPLEFRLAQRLIQSQGTIVKRDDLLKEVWGFKWLPQTRTVDYFLGRLRRHFEETPSQPRHFLTVRGAGYRFENIN
jgi:DNA-binding response OmpR family regulator